MAINIGQKAEAIASTNSSITIQACHSAVEDAQLDSTASPTHSPAG